VTDSTRINAAQDVPTAYAAMAALVTEVAWNRIAVTSRHPLGRSPIVRRV